MEITEIQKFTLTEKKFRQINYLVISLQGVSFEILLFQMTVGLNWWDSDL